MTHQVRDGTRLLSFEGDVLATISSQRDDPRWTEMTLYRTVSGVYILEKVGRSVVTHMPGCSEIRGTIPRFQAAHPGDDPDEGYTYHRCVPEEYDFTALLVEEDRYWAFQTREPEDIVEALYRKRAGSRHLPRIGIDLLEQVSQSYPAFGDAWRVEHVS
jgi:hypothetical protein